MPYMPLTNTTDDQARANREDGLKMAAFLGLEPEAVRAGSFEVTAIDGDEVRVRWTGLGKVSRADFIEAFPDAKIV
jgi:hypothetical protein